MEKKRNARGRIPQNPPAEGPSANSLPPTQTNVLAKAAEGDWSRFLEEYLRPCWREVLVACRARRLPLDDAEEVFQEFLLRLVRPSGDGSKARRLCGRPHAANLPGRYLVSRALPLRSARFRTYLKATIQNVIREALRNSRRRPRPISPEQWRRHEPCVCETVSGWVDRQWLHDAAHEAARRFRLECLAARTRGKRRLFDVLCLSRVQHCSQAAVAQRLGLDASTLSDLLRRAHAHFASWLKRTTGIRDQAELAGLLADKADLLREALARAGDAHP